MNILKIRIENFIKQNINISEKENDKVIDILKAEIPKRIKGFKEIYNMNEEMTPGNISIFFSGKQCNNHLEEDIKKLEKKYNDLGENKNQEVKVVKPILEEKTILEVKPILEEKTF